MHGQSRNEPQAQAGAWLSDMHLFVAVGQAKSFTRAAQNLGMPHSTLSRRISALEKTLGLRLLKRTTRQVELTEDGLDYFDRAERVVADALAIHEELSYRRGKPSGVLRMSIPECVALQVATPWIAEFAQTYPDVTLQIDTSPEHADVIRDGLDLCITLEEVRDLSNVRRIIASFKKVLYASPDYIRRNGMPEKPEELVDHHCICLAENRSAATVWSLTNGDRRVAMEVAGHVTTLSQVLAPELAKEGLGIAAAMVGPFQDYLEQGLLVRVLEGWELDPMVLSVVLPDRMVAARTRAFIDFFVKKYRSVMEMYELAR